jgi:hypothetical protein
MPQLQILKITFSIRKNSHETKMFPTDSDRDCIKTSIAFQKSKYLNTALAKMLEIWLNIKHTKIDFLRFG